MRFFKYPDKDIAIMGRRYLRSFLCACFALVLSAGTALAATTSGLLIGNETWSGTVVLTGDVTVPSTYTLTIEPGTTIIFPVLSDDRAAGADTQRTELIVQGSLVAAGSEDQEIVFTSGGTTHAAGDWYGIRGVATSVANSLELSYCTIEYGVQGVSESVSAVAGDLVISHSTIEQNQADDIRKF